jgi:hypothetical protein
MDREKAFARIERRIEKLEQEIIDLQNKKLEIIKAAYITCKKCNKKSRLGSWSFIQNMWYVPPYSCTGGDYWNNHETKTCHLVCPKCEAENYIYNHPQKELILELTDGNKFSKAEIFAKVIRKEDSRY